MTDASFRDLLRARLDLARVTVTPDEIEQLEKYFRLLRTWNRTINLTGLPLDPPTRETIDRLFVEPLAAAQFLRVHGRVPNPDRIPNPESQIPVWFDLGSGGGSPAIPLKVALPGWDLTMVEARSRKAAFLREVVRSLDLNKAQVANVRAEDVPSTLADYVTARAVRTDATLQLVAGRLLRPGGWLMMFRSSATAEALDGFNSVEIVELSGNGRAFLHFFARMFHVEQTD